MLSLVAGSLAEAVVQQGRLEEAEALSRCEVEEIAAEDDVDVQMLWRLASCEGACVPGGELEEAEVARRIARRYGWLEPTDDVVNQISALSCLASVLCLLAGTNSGKLA